MTEFDDVIRLLKDERPQATELELDEIKQRVRRRAADPSRRSNQSMKSRIAILGLLVSGMLFSTAGAGLAISGGSAQSGTNAAISQYATPTPTPTPPCTPPGDTPPPPGMPPGSCATPTPTPVCTPAPGDTRSGAVSPSDVCGEGGVLPAESENAPTTETKRTAPAETESESGSGVLPAEETNAGTQPARQEAAAAQTSQLPFTGFAAIPVLLGGLALLTGGLVLRRRTRSE
jgi:hypothetical protein